MPLLPDEIAISLGDLDDHLKAILKIKLREFVHLNPIFNCIPSIDVASYRQDKLTGEMRKSVTQENVSALPPEVISAADKLFREVRHNAAKLASAMPQESKNEKTVESQGWFHTGELIGELELPRRSFFAGFDQLCPNKFRPAPQRRRRRTSV